LQVQPQQFPTYHEQMMILEIQNAQEMAQLLKQQAQEMAQLVHQLAQAKYQQPKH
jgi:hypothetical protein